MLKKLISILGGYGKYQEYPSLKTSFAFGTQSLAPPNLTSLYNSHVFLSPDQSR